MELWLYVLLIVLLWWGGCFLPAILLTVWIILPVIDGTCEI